MKPKPQENSAQIDLFNTPLADLLNSLHELYQLANLIDWKTLDDGAEGRVIPYGVIHHQADEPTVQQVEVDVFHQLPFRTDGKQHLQQTGEQQVDDFA